MENWYRVDFYHPFPVEDWITEGYVPETEIDYEYLEGLAEVGGKHERIRIVGPYLGNPELTIEEFIEQHRDRTVSNESPF